MAACSCCPLHSRRAPPRALPRAQDAGDGLARGFANPPESARPRTWWHWTNSNVTKDGITKDLEWMRRVLGGNAPAPGAFGAAAVLPESGLLGPVRLLSIGGP